MEVPPLAAVLRLALDLAAVDELLRLRERRHGNNWRVITDEP